MPPTEPVFRLSYPTPAGGVLDIVPVLHYKAEFASWVHQVVSQGEYQGVALELADFLKPAYTQASLRLPYSSMLAYDTSDGKTMLLPLEASDPFAEAARTALAKGWPLHFIDRYVEGYEPHDDPLPDSVTLASLGPEQWWNSIVALLDLPADPLDDAREEHMAASLENIFRFHPQHRILLVCGVWHALRIWDKLSKKLAPGELKLDLSALLNAGGGPANGSEEERNWVPSQVTVFQPDLSSLRQISCEIPLITTLFEFARHPANPDGPDQHQVWNPPAQEERKDPPPPPNPLEALSSAEVLDSLNSLLGLKRPRRGPFKPANLRAVADYLNQLREEPAALHHLLSQLSNPAAQPESLELPTPPAPKSVRTFTFKQVEHRRPQLRKIYQQFSQECRCHNLLDRQRAIYLGFQTAASHYHENTGEQIARWQYQVLAQFLRNYAILKGRLLPGLFEMVMGSRGVADDNYSYEVWDLFTFYPWCEADDVPTMKVDADQLFLGDRAVHQWQFHRRLPRMREVTRQLPFNEKAKQEDDSENWADDFSKGTICSYPPEDIVIEDYGRYLQKKAIQNLSSDGARVEPFSTSMLDGIDIRETLHNWHEKKLYVREDRRIKGGVGAVVIIFDQDPQERFNWKMTWHGEHAQESDMAFYATPKEAKIVGPGIARCEYGGLMLSYPNGRLANVWQDPFYAPVCQTKAEVLLVSALDYTSDKYVVYVAAQPPRTAMKNIASKLGRKIVYIPIGQLSPHSIKKIRVFHVLSNHRKRQIAKDYIW